MKKGTKKLKLTKITVVNLDRVRGGKDHCACDIGTNNGALNQMGTQTLAVTYCTCNC